VLLLVITGAPMIAFMMLVLLLVSMMIIDMTHHDHPD
jgi:hypothetical protein